MVRKIKSLYKYLVNKYIVTGFKLWGVHFMSYNIPPEFKITKHAKRRLLERLRCSEQKVAKVTIKAWRHGKPMPQVYVDHKEKLQGRRVKHHHKYIYRLYQGYVYIFGTNKLKTWDYSQKTLITVYKWENDAKKAYKNEHRAEYVRSILRSIK